MTGIRVGVVDVYVIRRLRSSSRVLTLRRAPGTRSPGSWETVHGRIEPREDPPTAAERELLEETGLTADRVYSLGVNPMYLHQSGAVVLAIAFVAFVDSLDVTLGPEHDAFEWLGMTRAAARFSWPREVEALQHVRKLLSSGDAGAMEDVLRVR